MTDSPTVDVPSEAEPPKRGWLSLSDRAKIGIIAGAVVLAIIIVGVIAVVWINGSKTPFEDAVKTCDLEDSRSVALADDGHTLVLDGDGETDDGLPITDLACMLYELDVPASITSQMESTRALDGAQSDEFNGIRVRWTYHPDDGLDIIFIQ